MIKYIYDRQLEKVVEKPSGDRLSVLPCPKWWKEYWQLMKDMDDILSGKK